MCAARSPFSHTARPLAGGPNAVAQCHCARLSRLAAHWPPRRQPARPKIKHSRQLRCSVINNTLRPNVLCIASRARPTGGAIKAPVYVTVDQLGTWRLARLAQQCESPANATGGHELTARVSLVSWRPRTSSRYAIKRAPLRPYEARLLRALLISRRVALSGVRRSHSGATIVQSGWPALRLVQLLARTWRQSEGDQLL